jgi:hypothetical protein
MSAHYIVRVQTPYGHYDLSPAEAHNATQAAAWAHNMLSIGTEFQVIPC